MAQETGIIIQARLGSTRLPNKLLKPFFNEKTLIDILIEKFLPWSANLKIILATTTNPLDDPLVHHCEQFPVIIFRGSEENVTDRFIEAAEKFDIKTIIRVCSDNPFFDADGTIKLLEFWNPNLDYLGYQMHNGRPTIKSHLGFWGEVVSSTALKKAGASTSNLDYLQHVTNFVYGHPESFKVKLIHAPKKLGEAENIRLTLDTEADYQTLKNLYREMVDNNIEISPSAAVDFVNKRPEIVAEMKKQIELNSK